MATLLGILSAVASAISGITQVLNNYFNQKQQQDQQQAGANRQIVAEEIQKAKDEAIAAKIDAAPVPTDKRSILGGM